MSLASIALFGGLGIASRVSFACCLTVTPTSLDQGFQPSVKFIVFVGGVF